MLFTSKDLGIARKEGDFLAAELSEYFLYFFKGFFSYFTSVVTDEVAFVYYSRGVSSILNLLFSSHSLLLFLTLFSAKWSFYSGEAMDIRAGF